MFRRPEMKNDCGDNTVCRCGCELNVVFGKDGVERDILLHYGVDDIVETLNRCLVECHVDADGINGQLVEQCEMRIFAQARHILVGGNDGVVSFWQFLEGGGHMGNVALAEIVGRQMQYALRCFVSVDVPRGEMHRLCR